MLGTDFSSQWCLKMIFQMNNLLFVTNEKVIKTSVTYVNINQPKEKCKLVRAAI
jgi:hypothetical protein